MRKRVSTGLLATILALQLITPAFASDISTPGTSSNAEVPLSVQATTLAVTVPTQLPVTVDSDGNHTYATNTQISNNSSGPIVVSNITMSASNGWQVSDYATDLTKSTVGTKKIGFEINGATTSDGDGAFNDVVTNFGSITAGGAQKLSYTAKIPPQSQALDTTSVANVVFTVDWYTGGNNSVETEAGALSLDKDLIQMLPGTSEYIRAVYQENQPQAIMLMDLMAEGSDVVWKSSDPSVATVSDGIVTGLTAGNSVITAQAGELTATCNVIVDELRVPITAIDFSKHSTSIVNGASETVLVLYNPEKFTGTTNLTVTSSNTSIATVTPENLNGVTAEDGPSAITITGIAPGSTVITATATTDNGTVTSTLNVKIEQPLTGISIEGPTEVKVGETIQLTAKKLPENTTDTSPIVWSSSDDSIATVDQNGLVTGVDVGTTKIEGKCDGIKLSTDINVISAVPPLNATNYLDKTKMATALRYIPGTITFSTESPAGKTGRDISLAGNNSIIVVIDGQNATVYADGGCLAPADSSSLFQNYRAQQLNLYGIDTSKVTRMSYMFYTCLSLTTIDLSSFNTLNVTSTSYMFSGCSSLTNLDLSSFNTSNVTDMSNMFSGCSSLTNLDIGSFNTSKVTNMYMLFQQCSSLTNLDLSSFNTSNVINMYYMFNSCSSLTDIDLGSFNTSKVTNMNSMFRDCSSLTSLDLGSFDTSNVKDMGSMFNGCLKITTLNISTFNTSKVIGMNQMFEKCQMITDIDLRHFDTSDVTSMHAMFSNCSRLNNVDLSVFNTSKVTSMSDMFRGCSNLITIDLSSFDTSNVTTMSYMLSGCNKLTTVYAKTQEDADRLNANTNKHYGLTVTVKAA